MSTPRRAFSLIETILVIVVIALVVPVSTRLMGDAAADRADSVNALRAGTLAEAIMESVIADVQSPEYGIDALADPDSYLDTADTGFRDRFAPVATYYTALGFAYAIDIGPPVASDGLVSGDPQRDRFRLVTARVTWPGARGGTLELSVSAYTGEVMP